MEQTSEARVILICCACDREMQVAMVAKSIRVDNSYFTKGFHCSPSLGAIYVIAM